MRSFIGKEKRKAEPSKEGLLGVEGINNEIILDALKVAGCCIDGEAKNLENSRIINKSDLYLLGLSGGEDSTKKRNALCTALGLPSKISTNMLVSVLNKLMSYEQLCDWVDNLESE